jgi:hypothetical protein
MPPIACHRLLLPKPLPNLAPQDTVSLGSLQLAIDSNHIPPASPITSSRLPSFLQLLFSSDRLPPTPHSLLPPSIFLHRLSLIASYPNPPPLTLSLQNFFFLLHIFSLASFFQTPYIHIPPPPLSLTPKKTCLIKLKDEPTWIAYGPLVISTIYTYTVYSTHTIHYNDPCPALFCTFILAFILPQFFFFYNFQYIMFYLTRTRDFLLLVFCINQHPKIFFASITNSAMLHSTESKFTSLFCRISLRNRNEIEKYFSVLIRGLGAVDWRKTKSCDTVSLKFKIF